MNADLLIHLPSRYWILQQIILYIYKESSGKIINIAISTIEIVFFSKIYYYQLLKYTCVFYFY